MFVPPHRAAMASTALIARGNKGQQSFALARFVAESVYGERPPPTAADDGSEWSAPPAAVALSAEGNDWMKSVKALVDRKDLSTFVDTVLAAFPDVLAGPASDDDVAGAFMILLSFLDFGGDAAGSSASAACDAVVGSGREPLRLRLLVSLFNFLDAHGTLKLSVFLRIVDFAHATHQLDLLRPYFDKADTWATQWALAPEDARELFRHIADALDSTSDNDRAQAIYIKYLETLESAGADVLAASKPYAVKAAIGYIKAPVVSQRSNLIDLTAVKALADDAKYGKLYELLRIFATERLAAYLAFHDANPGYGASIGLDHEQSLRTMRLLSLCSLAADSEEVAYSAVQETLQVPAEDVEQWVVDGITLGLIAGRIDQVAAKVVISRWTQRVFGPEEWVKLQHKLGAWRDNVAQLLSSVRAARAASSV